MKLWTAYWVVWCHTSHSQTCIACHWWRHRNYCIVWRNKTAELLGKPLINCISLEEISALCIEHQDLVKKYSFLLAKVSLKLLWGWHILSQFSLQVGCGMWKECYWCLIGWCLECLDILRPPNQEICFFYLASLSKFIFLAWKSF